MTYRSTSSADFFNFEEREEMRFLRSMKGVLRAEAEQVQHEEKLTQEQLADRVGMDPALLSRVLSNDRHNSTSTLFRLMHRLGRRWAFSSKPLPVSDGNRPAVAESGSDNPPVGPTLRTQQLNSADPTSRQTQSAVLVSGVSSK